MASIRRLSALAMALASVAGAAAVRAANTNATDAAACAAIEANVERLACYDGVHRAGTHPKPASDVQAANASASTSTVAPVAASTAPSALPASRALAGGALTAAWATAGIEPFTLRPYRAIYVLPLSVTDSVNRRPSSPAPGHAVGVDLPNRAEEVKFQLSAKTLLWPGILGERGDLWLAYTQASRWQLYQGEISRPFRETNHEPELVLNVMTDWALFGWTGRTVGLTLNHQSNGRALPLSRSWNRLIGHVGFERGDWSAVLRHWSRLRDSAGQDDNPDIVDHVGRADLTIRRDLSGGGVLSLRLRHTLRGGDASRGSAELDWSFPLAGRLHAYLQAFSGYGESLVDYNFRQNRIGIGFSLGGWN